mmetsp:Transcript_4942/g.10265  ORF Transcript_4942/g.10265 Transcript_4942/m.10265 type:complete len:787 (-) Transcript_4942:32-2392(-)
MAPRRDSSYSQDGDSRALGEHVSDDAEEDHDDLDEGEVLMASALPNWKVCEGHYRDGGEMGVLNVRGVSLQALIRLHEDILCGDIAPEVRLFQTTRDIGYDVLEGTTIKLDTIRRDGSMLGTTLFSNITVHFYPGRDALEKSREHWTIEDVANYAVMPMSRHLPYQRQIYLNLLDQTDIGEPFQGSFIMHARQTNFRDLVLALESHSADSDPSETFFWIDILCANPALFSMPAKEREESRDISLFQQKFARIESLGNQVHELIADFSEVLIFVDSWERPTTLRRTWCAWELLGCLKYKRPSRIVLAPRQVLSFLDQLVFDAANLVELSTRPFDLGLSQALSSDEKKTFDELIERSLSGYTQLNNYLAAQMSNWLVQLVHLSVKYAQETCSGHDIGSVFASAAHIFKAKHSFDDAVHYYTLALDSFRASRGPADPSTASVLNNLASAVKAQGKFDEALQMYEEALDIFKSSFGETSPKTALALNNIASIYDMRGQYEKALHYYKIVLSIFKEGLGSEHMSTAITHNKIADIYKIQGDLDQALFHYEKVLETTRITLGTQHPYVASALTSITEVYRVQGRYDDALEVYEKLLPVLRASCGTRHPYVAATLHNIALLHKTQGRLDDALTLYEEALSIRIETLGNHHPDVATTLSNIGGVYNSLQQYKVALGYFEQALIMRKKIFGPKHSAVAFSLLNIASVHTSRGNYEVALRYYEEGLAVMSSALGKDHPQVANALTSIASVYFAQRKWLQALHYFEDAERLRRESLGSQHESTKSARIWVQHCRSFL